MGTWNNDNGPAQATKFFYVGGRLFAFGQPGDGLYERTGVGIWALRTGALPNPPEDATYWANTWWAACADGVYNSADPAIGWALQWATPANHTARTIAGYGSYLYVSVMELVGAIEPTIHFTRYSTAGGWEFDFIASYTNPHAWPNALVSFDLIYYDSLLWWSAFEQGTGLIFRYHDGAAWYDYTDNLEAGRFLHVTGDGMYFISSSLDQVWRNAGASWRLDYDCADDLNAPNPVGLSEGDGGSLWFGADAGAGNIRAHAKQGGVWGIATSSVADAQQGAAIQAGGDIFIGGDVNVYLYVPSFDITPIGGGLPPQAMDTDGDGAFLAIGVYDAAGFPMLIKAPLPLTPTTLGAVTFSPGAGSAIGVKCSAVGNKLAVFGNFGNNEQVEVSEDGGASWIDIDPGTWGANLAQPALLDPDGVDELVVFLDAAQDAIETFDQGANWTTQNPALGFAPTAAAKLADGDEIIMAESPAGQVHYSPNRAHDLAGIGGPTDVVALEVA